MCFFDTTSVWVLAVSSKTVFLVHSSQIPFVHAKTVSECVTPRLSDVFFVLEVFVLLKSSFTWFIPIKHTCDILMPLRTWQNSLWTSVRSRLCARMRFLKVPAWPCLTFASVHPHTWFSLFQQHAAFSPSYSCSYVTKHVDSGNEKAGPSDCLRRNWVTIDLGGGGDDSNNWTWTCVVIWAILLISCPPDMISVKGISLFSRGRALWSV